MKKLFTLCAALMMLSASAETLNLYGDDAWTYLAPINSFMYDTPAYSKVQVLYPAADLTEMIGKEITGITFYTDDSGCKTYGGLMNLSMGETDVTSMSGYLTGLTFVGTGTMVQNLTAGAEVSFTFETPYLYNGGNLVFENVVVEAGNYEYTYFVGEDASYNSVVTYSFGVTERQFLPKTTFTYGGGEEPQSLRGDVDKDGNVGIGDVTALIDYILSGDGEGLDLEAADCDLDENVGIGDVTALIDYILGGSWD